MRTHLRSSARTALVFGGLALASAGCSSRVDAAPGEAAAPGASAQQPAAVKGEKVAVTEAKVPSFLNLTGQQVGYEE